MDATPYTERSNEITRNIDVSSPSDIVKLLQRTDAEIFEGVSGVRNLFGPNVLQPMASVANLVKESLENYNPNDVAIVLAGCGTSGRLGYLLSKVFNDITEAIISSRPFHYSIAGGDKSILTSQEAPEDDPKEGVSSLIKICEGKKRVIYIGITCGISAPFVGGQLEYCTNHLDVFTPVILGFNPVDMARNVTITGWRKTMRTVAKDIEALSKEGKAFIINPVLGAEAITGSSRMKGGSATKIILDATFLSAISSMEVKCREEILESDLKNVVQLYKDICRDFYAFDAACDVMANIVQRCGKSLKSGGALRYLASGWTGVIPLIDSTECPPTFGSSVNDVRGFVHRGYDFLGIEDYGKENDSFKLSFDDFVSLYPDCNISDDTVVAFIQSSSDPILQSLAGELGNTLKRMKDSKQTVVVVLQKPNQPVANVSELNEFFSEVLTVHLPDFDSKVCRGWSIISREALAESLYGCCLKWMVNAISTGGHVLLGKVYNNYMCDVKVSNNKLYHRSIEIIKKMCPEVSHEQATSALLKSIYDTDEVTDVIRQAQIVEHYKAASRKDKVVPVAIILLKLDCTLDVAKETLSKFSVIRNAIVEVGKKI